MADWAATGIEVTSTDSYNHSRQSSQSSERSSSSKENINESTADDSSLRMLILREGEDLKGESRTEMSTSMNLESNNLSVPSITSRQPAKQRTGYGTAKAKAAKSPFTAPPVESIPVEEIKIPNDANISTFTSVQLANFLKCLRVEDKVVSHLHRKSVDGKRFARMNDTELETLGMNNPVILFFRNKSSVKTKTKGAFML